MATNQVLRDELYGLAGHGKLFQAALVLFGCGITSMASTSASLANLLCVAGTFTGIRRGYLSTNREPPYQTEFDEGTFLPNSDTAIGRCCYCRLYYQTRSKSALQLIHSSALGFTPLA